ncbi:MAG: ATP-binding protein, partial [Bacteroidota bacterium]
MDIINTSPSLQQADHVQVIEQELRWFSRFLKHRIENHAESTDSSLDQHLTPPDLPHTGTTYATLVHTHRLDASERLILMLALAPHVRPELLDPFFRGNPESGRGYTEFGGVMGQNHGGFLPTGETAAFLVGGNDLNRRIRALEILSK